MRQLVYSVSVPQGAQSITLPSFSGVADPFSDLAPYGNQLGLALAKDEDTQICAEFGSFTGGTIGASGSAITKAGFLSGVAAMEATDMPGPVCAVFHPSAWASLRSALGD